MRRLTTAVVLPVAVATACFSAGSAGAKNTPNTRPVPGLAKARSAGSWFQYHRTASRHGVAPSHLGLLTRDWTADLDGSVYGEVLVVHGRVIAATENNTVYSLNPSNGHVQWRRHLGQPQNQGELQCGNINPLGITGTPAYDPATGSVFVVAETEGGNHTLWALNAATGHPKWHTNTDLVTGRDRSTEQQRSALLVAHGRVFTEYGGLAGDCGNYVGYITSTATSGKGPTTHYAVPTTREAGMWAPPGPVLGRDGNVYAASGNGEQSSGKWDKSDSVTELSPVSLHRVSVFAPSSWQSDNAQDLDLGSSAPVMVGHRIVIAGKRGTVYLLHQHFKGVGHAIKTLAGCKAFGGAAVHRHVVVMPCTGGVRKLVVGKHSMHWGWTASGVYGSPVIAGKKVYVSDADSATLRVLALKSGRGKQSVAVGNLTHFPSASIAGNQVFVATLTGVTAFRGS